MFQHASIFKYTEVIMGSALEVRGKRAGERKRDATGTDQEFRTGGEHFERADDGVAVVVSILQSKLSITGAGVETGEPTQEKETHTLEADSPEECAAWDVWVNELKSVRQLLRNVWTAAETVPV